MRIQRAERKFLCGHIFPEMSGQYAERRVLEERRIRMCQGEHDRLRVGAGSENALPVGASAALDVRTLRFLDGEDNVVGGYGRPVVERGIFAQGECVDRAVGGYFVRGGEVGAQRAVGSSAHEAGVYKRGEIFVGSLKVRAVD